MDDQQLLRYSRHILLDELGIEGQCRLMAAHALVIGAGGLGSPVALYLGTAGVGRITIVERAEGLAGTGSTLVPTLGFIAAGVLAIGGIALFIGARRRRAEEETS